MIVVVANRHDPRAQHILAHWGPRCARMLTAEDLGAPGWSLTIPRSDGATAVVGGEIIQAEQISGILTLRPHVFPEELPGIRAADRPYVAAEMTAFLLAWLAAQSCPVLNRPTASALAGPNWRAEQWTHAAARAGVPVRMRRRQVPDDGGCGPDAEDADAIDITAVGECCFGCEDETLERCTLQLARAAGVDLLCARFSRKHRCLLSAHPWPALTDPAILAAVRGRLEGRR